MIPHLRAREKDKVLLRVRARDKDMALPVHGEDLTGNLIPTHHGAAIIGCNLCET